MKLLITGVWRRNEEQLAYIRSMGYEVFLLKNECENLPIPAEEIEAVVCNNLFMHHRIEDFRKLKFIQLTSAGMDRVPLDYIAEHNIKICNAGGVYSIPMAEFALCGVLQLYKQSAFFNRNQQLQVWEKHRGLLELAGKNVCILGCGSVGNECAKRFSAFDCNVMGVDVQKREDSRYSHIYDIGKLDEILPKVDILVLTLPLTPKSKHIINRERLSMLKDGAVIVNIARGAIIDTNALENEIDRFLGAVLDVFEEEPLSNESSLWKKENAIITPHNSFVGDNNSKRLEELIYNNLRTFLSV